MNGANRPQIGVAALALLVTTAAGIGGCFGDWVSARTRPRRDQPAPAAEAEASQPAPAEPCPAYLAAVAEHCGQVLDGRLLPQGCHPHVVRVMALYREGDTPSYHQRRAAPQTDAARDEVCAQQLRAMPEPPDAAATPAELGPQCRAWAEAIRERCIVPLSSARPRLDDCGPDLLAFEGALGGITFGRPDDYEPVCRDALAHLRGESATSE
ncbi:MAG: hypothetical protein AB1Z98_03315 [Nannocystaceae bacterium]